MHLARDLIGFRFKTHNVGNITKIDPCLILALAHLAVGGAGSSLLVGPLHRRGAFNRIDLLHDFARNDSQCEH